MSKREKKVPEFFKDYVFSGKKVYLKGISKRNHVNYNLSQNQITNFFDLSEFDKKVQQLIKEKEEKEESLKKKL